jgi:hypothetical protein
MADKLQVEYDRADVKLILKRFKLMSDEAAGKIRAYAVGSRFIASSRVADNVKVSKTSKIGEFSYGYKSQRFFSGGASTLDMVYGLEFGSNRLPQFPARRREGYFIYPTLRKLQPEIIKEWESAFTDILKEFDK